MARGGGGTHMGVGGESVYMIVTSSYESWQIVPTRRGMSRQVVKYLHYVCKPPLQFEEPLLPPRDYTNERRSPPHDAGTPHLKQILLLKMEIKPFQRCLATRPHPSILPTPFVTMRPRSLSVPVSSAVSSRLVFDRNSPVQNGILANGFQAGCAHACDADAHVGCAEVGAARASLESPLMWPVPGSSPVPRDP